jgi:hypothetical protein
MPCSISHYSPSLWSVGEHIDRVGQLLGPLWRHGDDGRFGPRQVCGQVAVTGNGGDHRPACGQSRHQSTD